MRIACIQHVPFEGPAAIADWTARRGHTMTLHHPYQGDPLPDLDDFDMLILMGGPMSVNDTHLAYIELEKLLARSAAEAGKYVLGICLGAQIIASAFGARIAKGEHKEIGWFPIRFSAESASLALSREAIAFHWHGETFELPRNATLLGSTPACKNQGFLLGDRVLGLQFHLEATPDSVAQLLRHCSADIGDGPYEQPAEVLSTCANQVQAAGAVLFDLLDQFTTK